MGYVQMTLTDWMEMKKSLERDLAGVQESFVRIGYKLRQIEDQKLYEQDGYKSVAEFAKAEFDLSPSTVSRFMSINAKYSVDGYSDRLRPEFAHLGSSKLSEMLALPDTDLQMIQPETSRESIRELKQFNKVEPPAGEADDIRELIGKFLTDNPECARALQASDISEKLLNGSVKELREIVNPGGNRSYRKGLYFLMMYENRITIKKYGSTPQDMTWEEFFRIAEDVLPEEYEPDTEEAKEKTKEEAIKAEEAKEEEAGTDNSKETESEPEDQTAETPEDPEPEQAENNASEPEKKGEPETSEKEVVREAASEPVEETTEELNQEKAESEEHSEAEKEPEQISDSEQAEASEDIQPEEGPGTVKTADPEEIAPAQKFEEISENQGLEGAGGFDTEVIEKPFGSRKEYLDTLSIKDAASYFVLEYIRRHLSADSLQSTEAMEAWLREQVDGNGRAYHEWGETK